MTKYDAIVIGSGQAGTPLVFKLASEGKSVAFIEKNKVGGTCLNVGCTPTKTYVASARRMWDAQNGEALGVEIPAGTKINLKKVKERKDALIKKSVDGITSGIESNNKISFYNGEASFTDTKKVRVNDEILEAEQIFINVGGSAFVPEDYHDVPHLTNVSILELSELPEHLVIVGGSYIGLEFGQMFRRFGSKVTIVEQNNTIIGREDEEVSKEILSFMKAEGIQFELGSKCISAEESGEGKITVQMNCKGDLKREVTGSHLLLAIGRRPNTKNLCLEAAGIKINEKGFIIVDEHCQTNVEGIFAMGDCNGEGAFTHTAYNDFQIVSDYLFGNKTRKTSDRIICYGLFVDPPLGRAGLTQKQAIEKGYKIKTGHRHMSKIARAKEKGETYGFMSALIDAETDKILGATILGVGGDEIIASFLNVMYADKPYTMIRDSIQVHPTVSELIPTMLENLKSISE
jgi:pyruvate/2-oxoglutarate dehydrogenase complex dihydrolipoamide dehydrogenase (E3) component